jgi:hypothetical protein
MPPTPVKNAHTNALTVLDSNPIVTHVPLTESTNQIVDALLDSLTSKTKQNVEDVIQNVLPVPEIGNIVILVLKTENTPQNVDAQPDPTTAVLLLVAHVTIDVSLVKVKLITVSNVMISEPQPQLVDAQMLSMKKLMELVNFV